MSTEGEIGSFLGNNFFHIFSLRLTLGVCSGTTYLHESARPVILLLWLPQFWKPGEIQRTNFVSCGEYNHTYSVHKHVTLSRMYMYYLKCTAQFDKLMNMFHTLPHQLNEHLEREGEREREGRKKEE